MTLLLTPKRENRPSGGERPQMLALVCVHCRAEVAVGPQIAAELAQALDRVHTCVTPFDDFELNAPRLWP